MLRSAFYGIVVGAVVAYAHEVSRKPTPHLPATSPTLRAATLVVPEGDGNCRKVIYSNEQPQVLDAEIVPCASVTRSDRSGLPPVMRGYQDSLKPR